MPCRWLSCLPEAPAACLLPVGQLDGQYTPFSHPPACLIPLIAVRYYAASPQQIDKRLQGISGGEQDGLVYHHLGGIKLTSGLLLSQRSTISENNLHIESHPHTFSQTAIFAGYKLVARGGTAWKLGANFIVVSTGVRTLISEHSRNGWYNCLWLGRHSVAT